MYKRIKIYNKKVIALSVLFSPISLFAQYAWQDGESGGKLDISEGNEYKMEMQGSFSKGNTPLWLNANKYGLSSLKEANGYLMAGVSRKLESDSARRWAVGYGVDLVAPVNYTSHFIVQQAFVEARWLHGTLSIGAKEYPMEFKNQTLSSGSQTLGINARPVPQVRLALPEYWTIPILHGWLQFKGHLSYGMMTDENWQHDFTQRKSKFADGVLYHSKAGYLRIGKDEYFYPWSLELGLEMATEFGGKPYYIGDDGQLHYRATHSGLKGFWNAFFPGGSDETDGAYENVEGNMLGSWLFRLNYSADTWKMGFYGDHYFEDHSQMFFLDYDGYGSGEKWDSHTKSRFYRYKLKDIMLGLELNLKYGTWLRNVVVEYLYTKYQSGPYNHDRTANIPDHLAGCDNYYNHGNYPGWQHWGQVMGNPLYRSPIYNKDGVISVRDNRFVAYHLGIDGQPTKRLDYRVLATYQKGWGTYWEPFAKKHHNVSFLVESSFRFNHGWKVKGAYGMDFGSEEMLGHNAGFQLTVSKSGLLRF